MIRVWLRVAPTLLAILAGGCHGPARDPVSIVGAAVSDVVPAATASSNPMNGRGPMVTVLIRGTWENAESPPSANPPAGCAIHIETSQTGEATHVGRFEGRGATCANPRGEPMAVAPFWDGDPAPPYLVMDFTNEMVWTSASGDELWLRPNGGVFVLSVANGAASVRARITIGGGTGRFDGASGSMAVTGGRGPGESGDHLEYEGEITMRSH